MDISIHPPRAGRDQTAKGRPLKIGFQSTRPVRGGTLERLNTDYVDRFQSTRPVRGGTPRCRSTRPAEMISIHPPRAGRDEVNANGKIIDGRFQSTRPVRGGTSLFTCTQRSLSISIHPPRAGRDLERKRTVTPLGDFNPPAPCGAGQQSCTKFIPCILAQYTIQRAAKLLSAYQQAYFC